MPFSWKYRLGLAASIAEGHRADASGVLAALSRHPKDDVFQGWGDWAYDERLVADIEGALLVYLIDRQTIDVLLEHASEVDLRELLNLLGEDFRMDLADGDQNLHWFACGIGDGGYDWLRRQEILKPVSELIVCRSDAERSLFDNVEETVFDASAALDLALAPGAETALRRVVASVLDRTSLIGRLARALPSVSGEDAPRSSPRSSSARGCVNAA